MRKRIFAVCDLEPAYAYNLMEYIYQKQGGAFEVQAFTSVKSLCKFAAGQEIALLLISGQAMCREVEALSVEKIMILSEGELLEELSSYPSVYKYQASDDLIGEVMSLYSVEAREEPLPVLKKRVEFLGVYSPIKRALKTSFALALGQILARSKGVLYLNLEGYSGFEELMGREFSGDLIDLMYFVRQNNGNLMYKMSGMVQSFHNLDYLPPAFSPFDLASVTWEEWRTLLKDLERFSSYETIILDVGDQVQDVFSMLSMCTRIYMPVREDSISIAKLKQYEKLLKSQGYEALLEKTKKLKLPFHSSFGPKEYYMEQLIWGELGDFVRKLLREEEADGGARKAVLVVAKGADGADQPFQTGDGSGDLSGN